jgi:eukaryotic-like serine/threonine-protein kinase
VALILGEKLGPYEILTLVGQGGMGEVYRARDLRLDRIVAIKVLEASVADNPVRLERFEREARAIAGLNHPHICGLFDVGRQDGVDYLVMEFLEGETLDARLRRGPLPVDQALRYGKEIADALDHAHRRGFVHRDLKPANIMFTGTGAKLLDFGLAKLRTIESDPERAPAQTASLTGDHTLLGTLQYMAPEQLEEKAVDARADIFALGLVLYEMVTGLKAFTGTSHASLIAAILSSEPRPASSVQATTPPALDHVIKRCLAKDPDDRWQSARDVSRELEWIAMQSSPGGHATRPASRPRFGARNGWIAASVIFLFSLFALARGQTHSSPPLPIAFTIAPRSGTSFSTSGSFLAISPDGRQLAFIATGADGIDRLWIRPLDSTTEHLVAGTEVALQPFWSADSRFVAFFAEGQLKKLDVARGLIDRICDVPPGGEPMAGTWNAAGDVLFAVSGRGIWRVAAGGAEPKLIIPIGPAGEYARWPYFLPDGHHYLFTLLNGEPDRAGIYVAALDSTERTRVLASRSSTGYADSGHLFFVQDGTLVAQPFDVATFKVTGKPTEIAPQLAYNVRTGRGTFSVSHGGILAYRTISDTRLTWVDRDGHALGTIGGPGAYLQFSLSANDSHVATARLDPLTGTSDIWTINIADGAEQRVTFDPSSDGYPLWSPDSSRIIFSSNRHGVWELYDRAANGVGAERQLIALRRGMWPADWLPDGRLMIEERLEGGNTGLRLVTPDGGESESMFDLGQFTVTPFRSSRDGRWLAYSSYDSGSGANSVYVRSVTSPDGGRRIAAGQEPRWRADGRELYYLAPDLSIMAVDVEPGADFHVGAPHLLFQTQMKGSGVIGQQAYDVTSTGQRFLVKMPVSLSPITVLVNWPQQLSRVENSAASSH